MALALSAIYQGWDQNILANVSIDTSPSGITSTPAPSATYTLDTLAFMRPEQRIKFGSGTVTISWGLNAPALGDILVIPMSNLANGHVTLTNGSGFSENIPVPTTLRNGIPKTIVVDLSLLNTSPVARTSDEWHLVITSNPVHVTLGGVVAIYGPKTALLDRDFQWGYTIRKTGQIAPEKQNEYGTRYILNMQTMERELTLSTLATDEDADALEASFDANNGRGLPGLLWLRPEVEDAHYGVWQQVFERIRGSELVEDTEIIKITFTELSKGLPLL